MKKAFYFITVVILLLSSCEGLNMDIDDLPRTLRISVRQIIDVDGGWSAVDEGSQLVSTGYDNYNGIIGDVTVTPANDSYVRSDEVTATASNPGAGLVFAYWLLSSRTEESIDDESILGNILYDDLSDGELISLRTDSAEAQIIAAFALDGKIDAGVGLGDNVNVPDNIFPLEDLSYQVLGDNSVEFSYTINTSGSTKIVKEPRFRFFDETGNAVTGWKDFFQDNDSVNFLDLQTVTFTHPGVSDPAELVNWKVVVIYQDPANDNVYVVK